jgi:hypothetical protein
MNQNNMNRNQNKYPNQYSSRAESVSNWRDKRTVNEETNNDNDQKRHYSGTFNKNKNFDKNFDRNEGGQQRRNYNSFNRNRNDNNQRQNNYNSFNRNRSYDGHRQNNYNSFSRNRSYDRNNRYNRNDYNYVDHYEPEQKEVQKEYNILDYPELAYNQTDNEKTVVPNYLEMCKKTQQEDEGKKPLINVSDPKYWDRYIYTGPKFIKSEKQSPQIQQYLREASKNTSSILIPYKQILYSRDGLNWHSSWKETFTDEEWNNMNTQFEQDSVARVFNKMSIRYDNELQEAYDLYDETGEINGCLQCHIDSIKYEKYLEQLEKQFEEVSAFEESDLDSDTDYYSN